MDKKDVNIMAQNFFEELQEKKQNLKILATKAKEYGWIDADREQEIIEKAKFKFNVVNHGTIALKDCILESILEVTHLTESQLARFERMVNILEEKDFVAKSFKSANKAKQQ